MQGCFLQLQHEVLTFDEEVAQLCAVAFLMQLFRVVEFHLRGPCLTEDALCYCFGDFDSVDTCGKNATGVTSAFARGV